MKKPSLFIPFFLALVIAFFWSALFPQLYLIAFAPFLALVYTRRSLISSLWLALGCGLIIDLLSSEARFGFNALNYCLTTLLLHSQKKHFFEEKPVAISLFTALISCVSSSLQFLLLYSLGQRLPISWTFVITDLLGMPILDALYAFFWFTCPLRLYQTLQKKGLRSFFWKKNQLSG